MTDIDKEWIELQSPRRNCFAKREWIPVYGMKFISKHLEYPKVNLKEDFIHVETGIISNKDKDNAERMPWNEWDQDSVTPYVSESNIYHRAGYIYDRDQNKIGERLVMGQYIDADYNNEIYINQDFILAYKLVKHEDRWIRPKEGDREVIRYSRDDSNNICFVDIRADFIKDYLSALDASLRLYYYRERQAIVRNKPDFIKAESVELLNEVHNRCMVSCHHITPSGDLPFAKGVFVKLWRDDVDEEDTIPDYNRNSDDGKCHRTKEFQDLQEPDRYHLHGRLWGAEWVEPTRQSSLTGYSETKDEFMVQVDNTSNKVNLSTLRYEEVNKYLWFNPEVINLLVSNRGGKIVWDTMETGFVFADPDTSVHFGLNKKGLITVYAFDIARLPYWQQKNMGWTELSARPWR